MSGTRMLTAFFETRPQAEQARSDVLATGLSGEAVKITDGFGTVTGDGAADGSIEGRDLGQSLKSSWSPEHQARDDEPGEKKAGFVLTAHTPKDKASEVEKILHTLGRPVR